MGYPRMVLDLKYPDTNFRGKSIDTSSSNASIVERRLQNSSSLPISMGPPCK